MECLVEYDYKAQEDDELTLSKGDIIKDVVTKMDGWWEGSVNGKRGMFPDNFVKVITSNSSGMNKPNGDEVTIKPEEPINLRQKSESVAKRKVKAIYSYAQEQDDELSLEIGDVVEFMSEVEEGWWKGRLKGKIGIFPSNFVEDVGGAGEQGVNSGSTNGVVAPNSDNVKLSAQKPANRETITIKADPDIVVSSRPAEEPEPAAPKLPPKPVRETARCFYPYFAQNEDELTLHEGDIVTIINRDCEDDGWWKGELRGKTGLFPDNFVKIILPNDPIPAKNYSNNQPKMMAQERTSGKVSRSDSARVKESPTKENSSSQVDGIVSSHVKELKKSLPFSKSSLANKDKDKVPNTSTKPLSPTSHNSLLGLIGWNSKNDSNKDKLASPTTEDLSLDAEEFNSIERGEKLNHPTATRAKAPKRRPPSAIITRENEPGVTNGNASSHFIELPQLGDTTHYPISHKNSTEQTVTITTEVSPQITKEKELSPSPVASVNKPKQAIPWMAELQQKQITKKSGVGTTNSTTNVSTIHVPSPTTPTQPSPLTPKEGTPPPSSSTTKAPPLPAKPNIPPPTVEKHSLPVQQIPTNGTSSFSATASKFGNVKRMGISLPPTTTDSHHTNQQPQQISSPTEQSSGECSGFVSIEEHNKLKQRVYDLENEFEVLKKQFKVFLDKELGRGEMV